MQQNEKDMCVPNQVRVLCCACVVRVVFGFIIYKSCSKLALEPTDKSHPHALEHTHRQQSNTSTCADSFTVTTLDPVAYNPCRYLAKFL